MLRLASRAAWVMTLVAVACSLPAAAEVLTAQKKQPPKAAPRPSQPPQKAFEEGPPLEVEQVVKWLTATDRKGKLMINPADVPRYIRARRVAFVATEENLGKLKEAGASDEVLEAVRELAPVPEPPPEPPKPLTGSLTVNCAPAECSVKVGDNPADESKNGTLERELPFGSLTVEVAKPGYIGEKQPVEIGADARILNFTLKPDEATKAKAGAAVIARMLAALGEETSDILARGSWTWMQPSGVPVEWAFEVRLGPGQVNLSVVSGSNGFELECRADCEQRKSGRLFSKRKDMKGVDATRADQQLRLFRRYSVWGLARALRSAAEASRLKTTIESEGRGPNGTQAVHAEALDDLYDLVLDGALLPQSVVFATKGLPASQIKASYYDYVAAGRLKLPKRTNITLADPKTGAVQIRLDTIEVVPSLK